MFSLKKSSAITLLCAGLLLLATVVLLVWARSTNTLANNALPPGARMFGFPKVFLWAWERPELLEFIDPREVGVAFLAETILLRRDEVIEQPRLQPLKVPPGTTVIAVVRIETGRDALATLSDRQRAGIVEVLARIARRPNLAALQIDFDATESEREFYRALLNDVRRQMPESMPLSITALASWCIFDNWLDGLPVDEAVPMIFQMGIDGHRIKNYLESGGKVRASICRTSIGASTDEASVSVASTSRIYFFNPQPWTESSVRDVLERSHQ